MISASPIAVIDGVPIFLQETVVAAVALLGALMGLALIALWRAGAGRRREREAADERQQAIEERFAVLAQSSAELNGKVGAMAEWLDSRQADLARVVSDRLDWVGARPAQGSKVMRRQRASSWVSSTSGSR